MLWSVPALPLTAFLILLISTIKLGKKAAGFIGVFFIALSFIASVILAFTHKDSYQEILWTWIPPTNIAFFLDPLSSLMIVVITFVALLVALYSTAFMSEDPDIGRFFAYLNLFVSSMLVLVLADNLLLLFAGWECVGLCSYLLIGFWYKKPDTTSAANKAFIFTKIGDVFFLLGIICVALELNNLTISTILDSVTHQVLSISRMNIIAFCFLIAALAKSAQVPFHTWLPDAMLGPTPASALIHAATMVTAGVYLLARMAPLFALTREIQQAVLYIGAITLLMGSFSALRQSDLKRVLAYSTISQIGYMFLALGAGAWQAAMFHFMTHAFFKALLFLGAGAIGEALHHEYNMYKMGGLRKELPLTYYTFMMGSAALVGLPFVSSGFYSKELILGETLAAPHAGLAPWIIGCLGAFLTALYVGRMIILVFFGKILTPVSQKPSWPMTFSLFLLGILSLGAGFLQNALLSYLGANHHEINITFYAIASAIPIIGLLCAYLVYKNILRKQPHLSPFGIDSIYKYIFIKPYIHIANIIRYDFFIGFYNIIIRLVNFLHRLLTYTQTGRIGNYLAIIVASVLAVLSFMVLS